MSVTSDLTAIKNVAEDIKDNKVTNFAYDSTAYSNNTVESPDEYDWSQHNNIPKQTTTAMKMSETQIDKGWRLRFPILNKYFFNAFFGRVSYNLNKLSDFFYNAVNSIVNALGAPYGVATLDSAGRIPSSQVTETLMAYKGTWSALTNTPALSDGMSGAVKGDMYICEEAGTVTFGTGNTISFQVNDRVVYNGSTWFKWASGRVKSVSEVSPDSDYNVDLSAQSDITKVLDSRIIANLLYLGIGRKWVACTGLDQGVYNGASYADGIWVAFATGLWWSEDHIHWTRSSTSAIASTTFNFARKANGIWVAGSDSSGMWWSEDGKTWTQGSGASNTRFTSVIYTNGLFVASSGSGLWWSEDGKTWTQGTGGNTSTLITKVVYGNSLFVASSNSGLWWSSDGKAWTQGTGSTDTFPSLIYGNSKFVATSGSTGIWYSTDGKTWTQTSTTDIQGNGFYSVYSNFGIFVAGSVGRGIWYSADGDTWTNVTLGNTLDISCVYYANGIWLAGSYSGGTFISTDGMTWAKVLNENMANEYPFININFKDGAFVIGTRTGMYYSDYTTVD